MSRKSSAPVSFSTPPAPKMSQGSPSSSATSKGEGRPVTTTTSVGSVEDISKQTNEKNQARTPGRIAHSSQESRRGSTASQLRFSEQTTDYQQPGVRYITEDLIRKLAKTEDLSNITNLSLTLTGDKKIKYIENLDRLVRLQSLNLSSNIIFRIERLHKLGELRELNMASNQLSKIEGLEHLTQLQSLNLNDNLIHHIPLWFPKKMKALRLFRIARNQLSSLEEVSKLKAMPDLNKLELAGNPLADIHHYRLHVVFHLRTLEILDGRSILDQERKEAQERLGIDEVQQLEKKLDQERLKSTQLQTTLDSVQHEKSQQETSRTELMSREKQFQSRVKKMEQEIAEKDEQLKKKSGQLNKASQKLYQLEQELAFYKIDTKFGVLSEVPHFQVDSADDSGDIKESPYIGRARFVANEFAQESVIGAVKPQVSKTHVAKPTSNITYVSMSPPSKAEFTNLDAELEKKLAEVKKAEDKLRSLQADLSATQTKLANAETELKKISMKSGLPEPVRGDGQDKMRQQLAKKMQKLNDLKDLSTRMRIEIDRKQESITTNKSNLQKMRHQLSDKEVSNSGIGLKKLADLEAEITSTEKSQAEQQRDLEATQASIANEMAEIQRLQELLPAGEIGYDETQQDEILQQEKRELEEKIKYMEQNLQAVQKEANSARQMQQKLTELEDSLRKTEDLNRSLKEEVSKRPLKDPELLNRLQKAEHEAKELKGTLAESELKAESELEFLKEQLKAEKERAERMSQKIQEASKQELEAKKLITQLDAAKALNAGLKDQVEEFKNKQQTDEGQFNPRDLKRRLKKFMHDFTTSKNPIEPEDRHDILGVTFQKLQKHNQQLLNSSAKQLEEVQNAKDKAEAEVQTLKKRLKQSEDSVREDKSKSISLAEEQNTKLQEEVLNLKKQLENSRNRNREADIPVRIVYRPDSDSGDRASSLNSDEKNLFEELQRELLELKQHMRHNESDLSQRLLDAETEANQWKDKIQQEKKEFEDEMEMQSQAAELMREKQEARIQVIAQDLDQAQFIAESLQNMLEDRERVLQEEVMNTDMSNQMINAQENELAKLYEILEAQRQEIENLNQMLDHLALQGPDTVGAAFDDELWRIRQEVNSLKETLAIQSAYVQAMPGVDQGRVQTDGLHPFPSGAFGPLGPPLAATGNGSAVASGVQLPIYRRNYPDTMAIDRVAMTSGHFQAGNQMAGGTAAEPTTSASIPLGNHAQDQGGEHLGTERRESKAPQSGKSAVGKPDNLPRNRGDNPSTKQPEKAPGRNVAASQNRSEVTSRRYSHALPGSRSEQSIAPEPAQQSSAPHPETRARFPATISADKTSNAASNPEVIPLHQPTLRRPIQDPRRASQPLVSADIQVGQGHLTSGQQSRSYQNIDQGFVDNVGPFNPSLMPPVPSQLQGEPLVPNYQQATPFVTAHQQEIQPLTPYLAGLDTQYDNRPAPISRQQHVNPALTSQQHVSPVPNYQEMVNSATTYQQVLPPAPPLGSAHLSFVTRDSHAISAQAWENFAGAGYNSHGLAYGPSRSAQMAQDGPGRLYMPTGLGHGGGYPARMYHPSPQWYTPVPHAAAASAPSPMATGTPIRSRSAVHPEAGRHRIYHPIMPSPIRATRRDVLGGIAASPDMEFSESQDDYLFCNVPDHHSLEDYITELQEKITKLKSQSSSSVRDMHEDSAFYEQRKNIKKLLHELENRRDELEGLDLAIERQKRNLRDMKSEEKDLKRERNEALEKLNSLRKQNDKKLFSRQHHETFTAFDEDLVRSRLKLMEDELLCLQKTLAKRQAQLKATERSLKESKSELLDAKNQARDASKRSEDAASSLQQAVREQQEIERRSNNLCIELVKASQNLTALKTDTKDLERKKIRQEKLLQEINNIVTKKDAEFKDLDSRVKSLSHRLGTLQSSLAVYNQRETEVVAALKDSEDILSKRQSEIQRSKFQGEENRRDLEKMDQQISNKRRELEVLQQTQDRKQQEMKRVLQDAEVDVVTKQKEIVVCREQITQLDQRKKELVAHVKIQTSELLKLKEEREQEEAVLQRLSSTLNKDKTELKNILDVHKMELTDLENLKVKQAQKVVELEKTQRALIKEKSNLEQMTAETQSRKADLEQIRQNSEHKRTEVDQLNTEKQSLEDHIARLARERNLLDENCRSLDDEVKNLKRNKSIMKDKSESTARQLEVLEKELRAKEREINEATAQREAMHVELDSLKQIIKEHRGDLTVLEENIKNAEDKRRGIDQDVKNMFRQRDEVRSEVGRLNEQLQHSSVLLEEHSRQEKAKYRELQYLFQTLADGEREHTQAKLILQKIQEQADQEEKRLKKLLTCANSDLQMVREDLSMKQDELEAMKVEYTEILQKTDELLLKEKSAPALKEQHKNTDKTSHKSNGHKLKPSAGISDIDCKQPEVTKESSQSAENKTDNDQDDPEKVTSEPIEVSSQTQEELEQEGGQTSSEVQNQKSTKVTDESLKDGTHTDTKPGAVICIKQLEQSSSAIDQRISADTRLQTSKYPVFNYDHRVRGYNRQARGYDVRNSALRERLAEERDNLRLHLRQQMLKNSEVMMSARLKSEETIDCLKSKLNSLHEIFSRAHPEILVKQELVRSRSRSPSYNYDLRHERTRSPSPLNLSGLSSFLSPRRSRSFESLENSILQRRLSTY